MLARPIAQKLTELLAQQVVVDNRPGASGNIGFKVDFGNTPDFDALTAGTIAIKIIWKSK